MPTMPDDKTKVGEPDRSRVSGDQDYEVRYFAEKHGISIEGAIDLINRFGNNREKLEEAANKLRASAGAKRLWTVG
jgi:predicted xylose isomerase-like sugar epimerase